MPIFDVFNPPMQPDSELDPDLTLEGQFAVQGGNVMIAPGDWVDVDPGAIWPDPAWGLSFQVCNVYPEDGQVGILVLQNWMTDEYAESELSAGWITNNYRRMEKN